MARYKNNKSTTSIMWQQAWLYSSYKLYLFVGIGLLVVLFSSLPFFFHYIQGRSGTELLDPVLAALPSINLSIGIFLLLWTVISYTLIRVLQDPQTTLVTIYTVLFLVMMRYASIYLVALDPPEGLIPISDPMSNLLYGHADFITKDLFFSGHTSSMFICFLCLPKKREKIFALIATFLIAIFVLVQHVHYTVDVIAAPFFCFLAHFLAKRLTIRS